MPPPLRPPGCIPGARRHRRRRPLLGEARGKSRTNRHRLPVAPLGPVPAQPEGQASLAARLSRRAGGLQRRTGHGEGRAHAAAGRPPQQPARRVGVAPGRQKGGVGPSRGRRGVRRPECRRGDGPALLRHGGDRAGRALPGRGGGGRRAATRVVRAGDGGDGGPAPRPLLGEPGRAAAQPALGLIGGRRSPLVLRAARPHLRPRTVPPGDGRRGVVARLPQGRFRLPAQL